MIDEFEDLNRKDELDQASGLTMRLNAEAERAVRAQVAPERIADGKGGFIYQQVRAGADENDRANYPILECVNADCGDTIPLARLKMGRIRCTPCQALKENPRKR